MSKIDAPLAGMSPVEVVVDVFGGIRSVGRAIGIEGSTVLRWGKTGKVPLDYFTPLVKAAEARGKRLTLEELVYGRPAIRRKIVTFEAPSALARMAMTVTGCSA